MIIFWKISFFEHISLFFERTVIERLLYQKNVLKIRACSKVIFLEDPTSVLYGKGLLLVCERDLSDLSTVDGSLFVELRYIQFY